MKSYRELNEVDLKLKLLSGDSINVDNIEIKPYSLREIQRFGYSDYMSSLQWLCITMEDFIGSVMDFEKRVYLEQMKDQLRTLDFYIKLGGEELLEGLMRSISSLLRTNDVRLLEDQTIAIGLEEARVLKFDDAGRALVDKDSLESVNAAQIKLIHRENFDEFVEAIKVMNYLMKPKLVGKVDSGDIDPNPVDEETRQLMEQMEKNRAKVAKAKKITQQNSDDDVDIADIISAVSSKSNSLNKLNIWDLTLYQLYDEYARLELIDNYDFSIRAMMAGAERIELKHWSSKL
ncbi:hypothetical protein [Bacillus mojavensis]